MKVTIEFDTNIFVSEYRETVNAYFRREIIAVVAARRLGLSREQWERHMAGIFAVGNSEITTEEAQL